MEQICGWKAWTGCRPSPVGPQHPPVHRKAGAEIAPLHTQLSVNAFGKITEDGRSAGPLHMGDPKEALGAWLQPGPVPAFAVCPILTLPFKKVLEEKVKCFFPEDHKQGKDINFCQSHSKLY